MSENILKVLTEIGDLEVYATAPDKDGEAHVHVRTGYTDDSTRQDIPVCVNRVEYKVSITYARTLVEGMDGKRRPRTTYSYIRRPGWGKDCDKVSGSAHRKIWDACEYAFHTFVSHVGNRGFVEAECKDLAYKINRLDEQMSELSSQRGELEAKLRKLMIDNHIAPESL